MKNIKMKIALIFGVFSLLICVAVGSNDAISRIDKQMNKIGRLVKHMAKFDKQQRQTLILLLRYLVALRKIYSMKDLTEEETLMKVLPLHVELLEYISEPASTHNHILNLMLFNFIRNHWGSSGLILKSAD